jgi:hypothetical protein
MANFLRGWAITHIAIAAICGAIACVRGLMEGDIVYIVSALLGCAYGIAAMVPTYFVGNLLDQVEDLRQLVRANAVSAAEKRNHSAVMLATGGWKCSCGRVNADYVSTCACGVSKSDIVG